MITILKNARIQNGSFAPYTCTHHNESPKFLIRVERQIFCKKCLEELIETLDSAVNDPKYDNFPNSYVEHHPSCVPKYIHIQEPIGIELTINVTVEKAKKYKVGEIHQITLAPSWTFHCKIIKKSKIKKVDKDQLIHKKHHIGKYVEVTVKTIPT